MSEFSDREFHVGSLVGLRAFAVDSLGRLSGPSQGGIFTPGVNEAECKVDPYTKAMQAQVALLEAHLAGMNQIRHGHGKKRESAQRPPAKTAAPAPRHTVAGLGCKCGFYAYFDGLNDYMRTGRVAAVVEGFGLYTLGTRGFRTSKARLLALIEPPMGRLEGGFVFNPFGTTTNPAPSTPAMTPLLWSYVRRNYSEVPVFTTEDAALAEYPLYEPEVPTPGTTDDFWTRSESDG